MKYIRTKDGVFDLSRFKFEKGDIDQSKVGSKQDCYWEQHNIEYCFHRCIWVKDIIAQANTIKELCDVFVLETEGKITTYDKAYFTCFSEDWYHDYLKAFDSGAMLGHEMSVNGYGAIHVKDKGLKYVAKMNDKGELELL